MRFHQRCFLKARGVTQAREVREVLRADLPARIACHLSQGQCLDFDPLTSDQMHHRSIPTQGLFVCSTRRWGRLLLETLLLPLTHREGCLPGCQSGSARRRLAHPHPQQVLEQLLR